MTVEESNKLRESLGLKKLTLTSQDDAPEGSSDNPRLLVEEEEGEVYNAKDAIRKRRDKRMHEELITGNTLGDKEKEEEEESAADWAVRGEGMSVRNKRQRGIEEEKSKQQEEEEGRGGEVRLKVAHNIEDLREGETILTMRDKPILACGTDEEEEDDDDYDEVVLEEAGGPQGLAQREKDDLWRKEKHRNAWDPTLHWDEEEEGNDDLSGDNILDKYTTVEERAAVDARRRGFTLALSNDGLEQNITAELTQDVEGRLKEIMEENKRRSMMQSVAGGNIIRIQSDIMNTNEAAKFLKRRNKEARKGARLRRRRNNNKEEASASVSASGDGDDDIVIPPPKRTMDNNDDDLQDGEEDQELYRQLERQRMVEQKVKARSLVKEEPIESSSGSRDQDDDGGGIAGNNVIDLDTGASYVHDHMDTNDVKDENMGADDGDDDNDALEKQEEVDTDRDRVSDVGRMSRASEFCASIQTPVELKQAEKDEEFAAQRAEHYH
ncbi:glutamic acid-rich protein, putative [Perkinsus marinus ATCC 50983]|uniref:Glutamic acid-rich protein, putative n=1 Tax=Perkinsus marinus (strain ATCC 50983 / TXsc) TaxID=423536 RepID=C5LZF7_PERM5|nr:glutamic acid-rich protein, putative [Perkinsus marinus ATCC 50983]EEQ97951.1 glutamic acid-rich protein, putative [Perkinsus marinus ATCC 50983]|eukprot:XP_002765234.1 glutamic acid-rich protein, putative [Perkinsus marinus ATCC 50983]